MGIYVNPGQDAFAISANSEIYVDKTGLLAFTNSRLGQEKRFLCVSRPRRFGKSMAANMLCAYYGKGCNSEALFWPLAIAGNESFQRHLNQYDVLFLNMQQFLRGAGTPEYLVSYTESQVLKELQETFGHILTEPILNLPLALATIYAKTKTDKKGFVIIIDEWDCIFREAKEDHHSQEKYLDFLRDLLKDRTYVKLAYMTGILPIKKYGTHSALNIFDEFSMTDADILADYVGFTKEEVEELCARYGQDFEEARRWYDGYRFKENRHIYNPKSIADAMYSKRFKSYWASTETYEALKVYIDMNYDGLKDAIVTMLGDGNCRIDTGAFQNDMTNFNGKDDVLTLLVHLGYLAYDEERQEAFIPNEEVRAEFLRAIKRSGWNRVVELIERSEELLQATWDQEEEIVAKEIDRVHLENTSILSYNNENSLSCILSLAYYSARKEYTILREFPTGKGFADLIFLPCKESAKPAMVVELKWNQTAQGAVRQIKERKYVDALKEYKGNVLLVGINYDKHSKKHTCKIEKRELI